MVYGPLVLLLNGPWHVKTLVFKVPVVNVYELTSSQFKSPFSKVAEPSLIVIMPFILLLLINIFVLILINVRLKILYIFYSHSSKDNIKTYAGKSNGVGDSSAHNVGGLLLFTILTLK